jgi:serine/threonine protein kinase/tetratricopeptide (TPR) repeat protein
MPIDPRRAKELFVAALELPDPQARQALLDRECAGDDELRRGVAELLAAHEAPHPAVNVPLASPVLTAPYEAPHETPGTVIAGKYKLLQHLGEGGMGSVWMADQTEPVKRRVALKLIRPERGSSQAILARFEAERQAIALMDHPHIARLLDAGTTKAGSPFFAMELVKGVPLMQFCDEHKLPVPERLQLFQQVCSAVQHAHQKGIIHRDLKPSNILVESHDGQPVPKVIDFGLAKAVSGQQLTEHTLFTALGQVAGTPLYMAPEQAAFNALDVDTRADIYSLGVILYELLTGSTPIERETLKKAGFDEILRVVRESEPPAPSRRLSSSASRPSVAANRQIEPAKLGRFVKGELDWIVMKALAKERDRRYDTASGFARDIERFLNHEPVTAGPPSAAYKLRKFVRRNRPQVVAAGLVLLALIVGVAGTTWGLLEARRQERLAQGEARDKEEARQAEADRAEGERWAKQQALDEKQRAEAGEKLAGERLLQVEAEKKRVEEEKRVAQAVRYFLQTKLLGQADARAQADALLQRGGLVAEANRNVTVRELLDRAAVALTPEKVEANFPNQPLLQAEILATVGDTYRGVGEYSQAVAFLQRAAALRQRHLGPDNPSTLTTLNNLAVAYLAAGKLPQAIPLLEQVRDAQLKTLGPDHRDTLTMLANLASAYRNTRKLPQAISLLEQVRDAQVRTLGPDHPDTLATLHSLALAYRADGKLPQAISLLEQVRDAQVKTPGPDHPDTLVTLNSLAGMYLSGGKVPQAIPLLEQVRDAQVKTLGPDHPETLGTLHNLAMAYWSAKQLDRSIPLLEDVLKREEATLGRDHPQTLMTLGNLGVSYRDAGRLDEAIALLEEVYGKRRVDASLAGVGNALLAAYVKAGKTTAASQLIQEQLAAARKQFPSESPQLAGTLATVGKHLLDLKEYAEAEPVLHECLALRQKLARDKRVAPWQVASAQSLLGGVLLGRKKHAEAEPLLRAGYEGLRQDEKAIPPQGKNNIADAIQRLIDLYDATGKKVEATRWRQELQAFRAAEKNGGP